MTTRQKYHPWNAKAETWDAIENRYLMYYSEVHIKMIELIRYIKNSELSKRLYGSTSMDKLVISIYNPIDYRKESLHIFFNLDTKKWRFEYFAMPYQKAEFARNYPEEKGIEKLNKFIESIGW